MALWRKQTSQEIQRNNMRIQQLKAQRKEEAFMPHNSFFISDEGRKFGTRIDDIERRQAAKRPRRIKKEE